MKTGCADLLLHAGRGSARLSELEAGRRVETPALERLEGVQKTW